MIKRVLSLLLAFVLVFGLIPGTAQAAENIELRVWAAAEDIGWLINRLDAFEAHYSQWNITWNIGICAAGDAATLVTESPNAAADVFFYSNDTLYTLCKYGALLPLSKAEAADALAFSSQNLMNTVKDGNGNYYGYPVFASTWFMYYNKDVYSEDDIKSLETMLAKGTVAFEIRNSWYLPAFYFANGCTLFGEDGTNAGAGADFGGEKASAVTLRLVELMNHPNFISDYNLFGRNNLGDTVDACFSGIWDYAFLYDKLGESLGAAVPPTVKINGQDKQLAPYLASYAIGINGHTKHETAARALANFLANEESQRLRWTNDMNAPVAPGLQEEIVHSGNVAAKAFYDTAHTVARIQPIIAPMNYCWGPIGTFGTYLHDGAVTYENAAEMTEWLSTTLNNEIASYNPFLDVPSGAFYEKPVLWALANGITTGATADTFNPNGSCLRAHVVTFLHRAAGNPEPTATNNPFADVKTTDFFYKPVLWAVEEGITNGTSPTTFGSFANCNRAAVVTFLWRAAGEPEPASTVNPFTDVRETDFFYKAVLWAVENGITNGLTADTFGPTAACNRAQVVTFLYRAYN